jgi:putative ABC transport system permease protein
MAAVFARQRLDAAREGNLWYWVALWTRTIGEVGALAWRLHADALTQDVTYATRSLRKTPAFTLAALGTLTIGLGPTLVVANLIYQVVVAPLPFAAAHRLVAVWNSNVEQTRHQMPLSIPDYLDFRDRVPMFEALAAHTGTAVALVDGGPPRQLEGVLVTAEMFRVLDITPQLGRPLLPADSVPGAPPVMLVGPDLWRGQLGGSRAVLGRVVQIDGEATTIVGVLPEGLDFPHASRNAWLPIRLDPNQWSRGTRLFNVAGRLAPGVTAAQALDAMNMVARGLAETYPDTNRGRTIELIDLKDQINRDSPRLVRILAGSIAAVLLIACLNVASLLVVRASVRNQELAIRAALGATSRRLRRQVIVEQAILAGASGLIATGVGWTLHRYIVSTGALPLPTSASHFSWQALVALLVLVGVIAVTFALVSAQRVAAPGAGMRVLHAVRHTHSKSVIRSRQLLVLGEIALALVVVVSAGLLIRSAARVAAVDPGFRTDSVLSFGALLPTTAYPEPADRQRFVDRVVASLEALPGVRSAAVAGYAPMGEMRATRRVAPANTAPPPPGEELLALDMPVGPSYFEVMGLRLLEGRVITAADVAQSAPVVVVSERFAREVFPGQAAIGQHVRFFSSRPGGTPPAPREIVGVVTDVRQDGMTRTPIPQMYVPYAQAAWGFVSFFVRADVPPESLAPVVPRIVSAIDPLRPVRDIKTTAQIVRDSTRRSRAITWMMTVLALIALMLSAIGLYGVTAIAASARSRELAIRAAVGAPRGALLRLVVSQGLATTAMGLVVGALAAAAVTRALATLLYETPPRDPLTFVATAFLLLVVGVVATYLPARRALAQNPSDVLRAE